MNYMVIKPLSHRWLLYLAPKRKVAESILHWICIIRLAWTLAALWVQSMVLLQLKHPLELSVKIREFLPSSVYLSHCDMAYAVESNVKTNSFHPPSTVLIEDRHANCSGLSS